MNRREFVIAAAALAIAPDALARRLGAGPAALVTADLEARVVAVDLSTGRRLRHIPTLPGPRSIERVGETAVVAHTEHGAVSLIDGTRLRIRKVLHDFDEPRYTAAAPGGDTAKRTTPRAAACCVPRACHERRRRSRRRRGTGEALRPGSSLLSRRLSRLNHPRARDCR